MITYRWRESLDDEEARAVDELLDVAADYDAEAGFSTVLPVVGSTAATRHVIVTIAPKGERGSAELDELPDVEIVAFLRLDLADGDGDVQFVVRPEFRSRGVATLLTELLDEEPGGWSAVPGLRRVRAWAHGNHPAAERLARRLGATAEHGVFRTLREVGGSRAYRGPSLRARRSTVAERPAEVVPGHGAGMAPDARALLGRGRTRLTDADSGGSVLIGVEDRESAGHLACVVVETPGLDAECLRNLVSQALLEVQDAGARKVVLYVDALHDDLVRVSRELAFEHDHSDLRYVLSRATGWGRESGSARPEGRDDDMNGRRADHDARIR
ncbi:hypothetical protein [Streptomyces sp. NPDC005799]|uniref:hypothetical protein n=1 Tax=Streptomyces sp. NPDC005799 TaxID=3154678 RepID=UPI0033DE6F8D